METARTEQAEWEATLEGQQALEGALAGPAEPESTVTIEELDDDVLDWEAFEKELVRPPR